MDVIIRESGKKTGFYHQDQHGLYWAEEIIQNFDGTNDGQFTWDDEKQVYFCDQDTFDWWDEVLDNEQELTDLLHEVRNGDKDLSDEEIEEIQEISNRCHNDDLEVGSRNALIEIKEYLETLPVVDHLGYKDNPTRLEIAKCLDLWKEYVDRGNEDTRREFYSRTIEENLEIMNECFGESEEESNDE